MDVFVYMKRKTIVYCGKVIFAITSFFFSTICLQVVNPFSP